MPFAMLVGISTVVTTHSHLSRPPPKSPYPARESQGQRERVTMVESTLQIGWIVGILTLSSLDFPLS
ncbi:hypothetical protein OsJ_17235 [Oryza sativa Japonica Group]|uniref:Uncharacterized protein n=1 Tax=Oryza sativa subsp. japonica TaxID=39947 RepID=B9FMM6_ORYSJ|nr:hypothetical protein OsJ_17235 [Oryza sativa Japonica Group]